MHTQHAWYVCMLPCVVSIYHCSGETDIQFVWARIEPKSCGPKRMEMRTIFGMQMRVLFGNLDREGQNAQLLSIYDCSRLPKLKIDLRDNILIVIARDMTLRELQHPFSTFCHRKRKATLFRVVHPYHVGPH